MYPKISLYCIQVYFRPVDLTSCYTCEEFRPVLNSPRQSCVKKKWFKTREFAQFQIRPLTTRAKEAEIKRGRIFQCIRKWWLLTLNHHHLFKLIVFFLIFIKSVYLLIYLFIHLFIHLSIHLFIHFFYIFYFYIFYLIYIYWFYQHVIIFYLSIYFMHILILSIYLYVCKVVFH